MKGKLAIGSKVLNEVNEFLTKKSNPIIDRMTEVIDKYGDPKKINDLTQKNGKIETLMEKLQYQKLEYVDQLNWLIEQRDGKKFISLEEYKNKINTPQRYG